MHSTTRRHFLARSLASGSAMLGANTVTLADPFRVENSSYIRTLNRDPQDHHDPHLHLFIDDEEITEVKHLARIVNRPKKHHEPVLSADRPWEGERAQAWGSVIQEPDGLFRMWYFAFNTERRPDQLDVGGYCYAESRDGIHWEKPDLGLFDFRGSKRNNLFYSCAPDGKNQTGVSLARQGLGLPAIDENGHQMGILNNLDGLTVVRDDDDPDPQRRYKLIANMQDHRMWASPTYHRYPNVSPEQAKKSRIVWGQYMDTSPDGIHWTRRPQRMVKTQAGDYMMVTRDHRNRRWWLNERATGEGGRNASLRTSKDWKHWSELEVVYGRDSDPRFNINYQWHGGITPFNYGNLNLGFLEKWPLADLGATCELISQREGGHWQRTAPGSQFLDVGPEGSFDRLLIYPSHNPPCLMGDQLGIFYTGASARNHPRRGMPMSMGLATIGLDRFAGLGQWRSLPAGRVITKSLTVPHPELAVNVEHLEHTPIRVAVTTPDGAEIPGYGLEDSQVALELDRVYTWAKWRNKPDLSELVGKEVAFHFEIRGAVIYSYRFYAKA